MSSRKVQLNSATWSAVTLPAEAHGHVQMAKGAAVFTVSGTTPTGGPEDNSLIFEATDGRREHFEGIEAGALLYGLAAAGAATVDVFAPEGDAFAQGRTYRVDIPFTIPQGAGGELFLKYQIGGDIDLTQSTIELTAGGAEFTAWASTQASGEAGIVDPVIVYPKNSKSTAPVRASTMNITRGNSWDGATLTLAGTANTHTPLQATAGGSAKGSTVSSVQSVRGFPATTAYVRIQKLDDTNVETRGVLKQEWTEYN